MRTATNREDTERTSLSFRVFRQHTPHKWAQSCWTKRQHCKIRYEQEPIWWMKVNGNITTVPKYNLTNRDLPAEEEKHKEQKKFKYTSKKFRTLQKTHRQNCTSSLNGLNIRVATRWNILELSVRYVQSVLFCSSLPSMQSSSLSHTHPAGMQSLLSAHGNFPAGHVSGPAQYEPQYCENIDP